ncbi:MarR family transcriptional regulator [bacterium]|nr:MarR family transcriptional regulator [bacterium]
MKDLAVDEQIVVVLRRITQAIDLWSRELQRNFGLTSPQLAVLREVAAGVHVTPTSLGEILHLSQPTVTGILQRLSEAGYVARERSDSDRRSIVAHVTEEGAAILSKAPPLLRDQFRERLAEFPEYRQTELLSSLQLVADMLQAPTDGEQVPFLDPSSPTKRRSKRASSS